MTLPPNFEFSQASLQDYTDCQRRFLLRYIRRVAWPAVQAEPILENERHIRRGERFHRLAQQYLTGVPADRLAEIAAADEDEHLSEWWQAFTTVIAPELAGVRHVESALSAPLAGVRLAARYDLLLAAPDGSLTIYDWKTSLARPKRAWLSARLQTRVYPFLLVRAGAHLNQGQPVRPEQVSMLYWFTAFPHQPERYIYTPSQYAEDVSLLEGTLTEIRTLPDSAFDLTPHAERCAYCVYRSLCDRGISAGPLSGSDSEPESTPLDLNLDLDQIAEIGF